MTMRWLARSASLLAVAVLLCGQVPILNPRQYRNVDYEFSVNIPSGLHGCKTASPNPNHGLWIPLDRHWSCEDSDDFVPYVSVSANSNTAFEAATPARLAAVECRWQGARHIVWLKGERISGRHAAGCRRDFPDGHVEVTLFVLRKTEAWRARWEEVSADLVTTPAHYRADMRTFRQVVRGVWVHPDGPMR